MAVYVIGDLQGCYRSLKKLLNIINFKKKKDQLWFVGDLVNRGPDSLKTLRYIKSLGSSAKVVLGNHDLHLLALYYMGAKERNNDTLRKVLNSKDCDELMNWLRCQPLIHHDISLNFTMVHAGIYPGWTVEEALKRSAEVERVIRGRHAEHFFLKMYGNKPLKWSASLRGMSRLRFITNSFTRMRYLKHDLTLDLTTKGNPVKNSSKDVKPWYEFKQTAIKHNRIVFGHWSTLPTGLYKHCFAVDSGCLWGGSLTALRIDKLQPSWHSLPC